MVVVITSFDLFDFRVVCDDDLHSFVYRLHLNWHFGCVCCWYCVDPGKKIKKFKWNVFLIFSQQNNQFLLVDLDSSSRDFLLIVLVHCFHLKREIRAETVDSDIIMVSVEQFLVNLLLNSMLPMKNYDCCKLIIFNIHIRICDNFFAL